MLPFFVYVYISLYPFTLNIIRPPLPRVFVPNRNHSGVAYVYTLQPNIIIQQTKMTTFIIPQLDGLGDMREVCDLTSKKLILQDYLRFGYVMQYEKGVSRKEGPHMGQRFRFLLILTDKETIAGLKNYINSNGDIFSGTLFDVMCTHFI